MLLRATLMLCSLLPAAKAKDPTQERLAAEAALVQQCAIRQVKPLALRTPIVDEGRAQAILCHADEPAWRDAALLIQQAVREATGVELPLKTDKQITAEQFAANHLILLGHLDNHCWVARLYHNFFVCLDQGFTGRKGYELRTVHSPFGTQHNYVLVGGSTAEGTRRAAEVFAALLRKQGKQGQLSIDRLLDLQLDPDQRQGAILEPLSDKLAAAATEKGRRLFASPGQGRSAVGVLLDYGMRYHRTGDPACATVARELFLALEEYHRADPYIVANGMTRYDRDFRDAYTYEVAIIWDLIEECGLFSDAERLAITNLIVRLGLECVVYQGWNRPGAMERWAANKHIVHNHLTFPATGVLFAGNYLKRHYQVEYVNDWLTVARGIFNGQKHCSKPMEDSAAYQWLPVIHTMIYSLAENDLTFFEEGHAREAADVALMVMDNAGYQAAFGDHSALTSASCIAPVLQVCGWYYRSPGYVWGSFLAGRSTEYYVGNPYNSSLQPEPPREHVGLRVARLPLESYEYARRGNVKGPGPNLPLEQVFDKLSLRGGWQRDDEYLMLDGHGRGNHMHFDVNAIISYAAGGCPLLVDGEYIKSLPKYHNSLVVMRDGAAAPAPAVAGLGRAEDFGSAAYARTWVDDYTGAQWTRSLFWRRNDYLLVRDEVRADKAGRYTLRCCWRPWGEATLHDEGRLEVKHAPMRLTLVNADGAPATLEKLKTVADLPVSCLAQQVSLDLKHDQAYRFVNVLRAEPLEGPGQLAVRAIAPEAFVVQRGVLCDVVAFGPGQDRLPGLSTDAEMLLLADDRLLLVGCSRLNCEGATVQAETPISIDLDLAAKTGRLIAATATRLTLRLAPGFQVTAADQTATADASGSLTLSVPAGSTPLALSSAPPLAWLRAAHGKLVALPTMPPTKVAERSTGSSLPAAWQHPGVEPPLAPLAIQSVKSSRTASSNRPVEDLIDGKRSGSVHSTIWSAGRGVEITLELAEEADLRGIALYEWQGNPTWGIGDRQAQVSCDGFQSDIREVPGPFSIAGRVGSSGSENVRMEAALNQKARQVRIKLAPASEKTSCYLSEVELLGVPQGKHVPLNAMTAGDLDGDGTSEIVVAGESGRVMAVSAKGVPLWNYDTRGAAAVDALACADVDGDRRCEVLFGGRGERVGLIDGQGQLRWEAKPARYRGTASDVRTVFPGDVNGDGRPEVLCGCVSWQYFAYDAQGKLLWPSVIYAHSATVGCAKDLDGDGQDEVIAGNAYYQLNVLRPNGRRLWVAATVTPEMTAVAAGSVDATRSPKVFCGMDGGDLFCFDAKGKQLWRVNLGDKVTRIALVDVTGDGIDEVVCAAQSAQVVALTGAGKILWQTPLPGGVYDLAATGTGKKARLAVSAGRGGLLILDGAGKILGRCESKSGAQWVVVAGSLAAWTNLDGSLQAVTLPQ